MAGQFEASPILGNFELCFQAVGIPKGYVLSGFPCCLGDDRVFRHNVIWDVVCSAVTEFTAVSPPRMFGSHVGRPGSPRLGTSLPPCRSSWVSSAEPLVAGVFNEVEA